MQRNSGICTVRTAAAAPASSLYHYHVEPSGFIHKPNAALLASGIRHTVYHSEGALPAFLRAACKIEASTPSQEWHFKRLIGWNKGLHLGLKHRWIMGAMTPSLVQLGRPRRSEWVFFFLVSEARLPEDGEAGLTTSVRYQRRRSQQSQMAAGCGMLCQTSVFELPGRPPTIFDALVQAASTHLVNL